jgi:sulfide:quinone oxidoreductase
VVNADNELGDVAALPILETGAAVRKQLPVLMDNILKLLSPQRATNIYY